LITACLAGPDLAAAGPGDRPPIGNGVRAPAEVTARATLDRWLAAQNQGRYDDYAALYAPSFAGVKRVGKVAKKMNRAAWLRDRKAMFKAPLQVGATDVKVTLPAAGASGGAVLDFTQHWASGAFADVGPKRMVLDAAGAQIVSEELLSSRPVLTETACATGLYPGASMRKMRTGRDDGVRPIRAVVVTDLGGRWLCKVLVEGEDRVEAALGLYAFGKKWELRGRLDLDYDEREAEDEGSESVGGDVNVEPLALHASIPVVKVEKETRRSGPQYSDVAAASTIYRVDGDAFEELLSWESGGSSGEADKGTTCDLDIADRKTKGWADLTLTCTTSEVQWAAGENEPTESTETTRYRWNGDTYAEP
jgi:hypothetical protein